MVKITIDIPDEIERRAKMLKIELSLLIVRVLKEKLEKLEKIDRIKKIAAKSQATDEDVKELTREIENAMTKHYSKY
ncbi:hypothetical protein HYV49_03560 [Candidatus Pacearchaeota archaeon]|nr:hypothetical protein [Candidatus Pacearchaeota archaeon]